MKISQMKTNGVEEALGFAFLPLSLSWSIEDCKYPTENIVSTRIIIKKEGNIVFDSGERKNIDCLDFNPHIKLESRTYYTWTVEVKDNLGNKISASSFFETGKMYEVWNAKWINAGNKDIECLKFSKVFSLKECDVKKSARLYICALGVYEVYINGEKVGYEYLAPGYHSYDCHLQTFTYDVTKYLKSEANLIEIYCADGWYKGRLGFDGAKNIYGDSFYAIAELYVNEKLVVVTDKSWKACNTEIVSASIYDGEVIDARNAELENIINYKLTETSPLKSGKLIDRYSLAVIEKERFCNPIFIHTPNKECVLDFSQNLTGFVTFLSNAKRGMEIKLSACEILQKGCFFHDNYRSAKAEFIYISDGKQRRIRPHFTFFGFRYMKVECRTSKNDSWRAFRREDGFSDFEAVHIRSDIDQIGFIKTGNCLVNKLFENAMWSEKDNFLDVPTDCPQRDERLGWTGDAQIFSNTALYNMDLLAFFRKWLFDMRAEQKLINGACPNIVPRIKQGIISEYASSPWADAAVIVPWNTFLHSGNKTFLEEAYDGMKMWLDYEYKNENDLGGEHLIKNGFHFADWLALDSKDGSPFGATDSLFIASCYYLKNAEIVSKAAEILLKSDDIKKYTELSKEIKKAIIKKYFDEKGLCKIKTQTALSISIVFSLSKDIKQEGIRLARMIKENNGALNTGFVGNAIICHALAESGNVKLAYDLLLREEYPSWLYSVKLGASTIWERWDSVLPDGSMKKEDMNSLNHYSYGSIVSFLYEEVFGISIKEAGFKTVNIAPKTDKRLNFASCKLQTVSGIYKVSWKYEKNNKIKYQINVPFGCSAYFVLNNKESKKLTSGQYIFIS